MDDEGLRFEEASKIASKGTCQHPPIAENDAVFYSSSDAPLLLRSYGNAANNQTNACIANSSVALLPVFFSLNYARWLPVDRASQMPGNIRIRRDAPNAIRLKHGPPFQ